MGRPTPKLDWNKVQAGQQFDGLERLGIVQFEGLCRGCHLKKRVQDVRMLRDTASDRMAQEAQHCSKIDQNIPADNEPVNCFLPHPATHRRGTASAKDVGSPKFWHHSISSARNTQGHADRELERAADQPL